MMIKKVKRKFVLLSQLEDMYMLETWKMYSIMALSLDKHAQFRHTLQTVMEGEGPAD